MVPAPIPAVACPTSSFTGCRTEMWGDEATSTSHGAGAKARSEGYRLGTIWVSSCPRQLLLLLLVLTLTLQALHTQFFPPLSSLPFSLQVQLLFPSLKTQGLTEPIHAASHPSSLSGTKAGPLHWWPHKQEFCCCQSNERPHYTMTFPHSASWLGRFIFASCLFLVNPCQFTDML